MLLRRSKLSLAAFLAAAGLILGTSRDASAQIYVSDVGSNSIKVYDQNTGAFIKTFASGGGLSVPFGLAWGPDNNLYVASLGTSEIIRYNGTTGAFMDKFVTKGGPGQMYYPNQIGFGPNNDLYVASYLSGAGGSQGAILEYQGPTGSSPGAYVKAFASDPGMKGPTGFVFNQYDGNLYVSSSSNNAIYRFDGITGINVDGGPLVPGAGSGLNGPAGMDIGPDGRLYVTNFYNPTGGGPTGIVQFNPNNPADKKTFTGTMELGGPADVLFGDNFKMFVTSYRNNTIYRFDALTGAYDPTFTLSGGNLVNPTYMIFGRGGSGGNLNPVPEPSSTALFGLGLLGLGAAWRRRRR